MRSSGETPAGSRSSNGVDILIFLSSLELFNKLYRYMAKREKILEKGLKDSRHEVCSEKC